METITIFNITISVYWTVFILGCISMFVINLIRRKKFQYSVPKSIYLTALAIIFSFIGAKILYTAECYDVVAQNGIRLGGVSFFGAVFLYPLFMFIFCRLVKFPYGQVMDFLAVSLMLMLAVLRIGCYFSGCCGGITIVSNGTSHVVKIQLIEAALDIAILFILLFIEYCNNRKGYLYVYILLFYGAIRFFCEFYRDTPKHLLGMSNGQVFSIAAVVVGVIMILRIWSREKKEKKTNKNLNINRKRRRK